MWSELTKGIILNKYIYILFCMTYIYVFSWIEKLFFHQLYFFYFQMLSIETRNQGKKNGNVVRTYI